MNQAIVLAKRAFLHDDVPIGAVIVRDGKVVARGENQVQLRKNPTLHAEIVAINPRVKGMIAIAEKIEDCPPEFLAFAKEHNLPIILMKSTDK